MSADLRYDVWHLEREIRRCIAEARRCAWYSPYYAKEWMRYVSEHRHQWHQARRKLREGK